MNKSEFSICVKDCQLYFERDEADQQFLRQGSLVRICEEEQGVSTVNLFHINYVTKSISVIDKRYLCEQKFLHTVSPKLFRFLISEQLPAERCQLLANSDTLVNLRIRKEIELNKSFLKYFNNIICQVIYIGEVPELGVGDFIGIKLMNCSLPLIMVDLQKRFASKYTEDLPDSFLLSATDFIRFYIKEIRQPVSIANTSVKPIQSKPIQQKIYMCSKCLSSDCIVHFRNCTHRMCKDCLVEKFRKGQKLQLSCNYRMSQDQPCSKIITLEHFIFLYPELAKIFNEIKEQNRKVCFICSVKSDDDMNNIVQISDCQHFLCKPCALKTLTNDISLLIYCRFVLNDGNECKAEIQENYLNTFMSQKDLAVYQERKLLQFLETTPNSRRCKTPNCKYWTVADSSYTGFNCQLCKHFNCLKCDAIHNVSCNEYQRRILDGTDEIRKNLLLAKLTKDQLEDHDLVRKGTVENYSEATKFRVLRQKYKDYEESDLLWAIRQSDDMAIIEKSLNVECDFCSETFSHNNMFGMITCQHTFCNNCAKTHFTIQITEKTIRDCICPTCKLPTLDDDKEEPEYFALMGALLKNILDPDTYELFDRKTRDRGLRRIQNFVWCVKCENGFEVNPNRVNAACAECNTVFCIDCNEIWKEQHAGITCDQYKQWKVENDPKNQSEGVANYLDKNGIECPAPNCRFKYSLAKGGCLHFTCSQCSYQFCFGCRQPMLAGAKCTKFSDCGTKGLHAHHPRNCLFILRDCTIASLESLLTTASINFTGIPQEGAVCQIPIQRETPGKMIDCLCEKPTINKNIGLCEQHYKEGLVDLIFKSKIDPADILDLGEAEAELIRNKVARPPRLATDTDLTYKAKCVAIIKQMIPLV